MGKKIQKISTVLASIGGLYVTNLQPVSANPLKLFGKAEQNNFDANDLDLTRVLGRSYRIDNRRKNPVRSGNKQNNFWNKADGSFDFEAWLRAGKEAGVKRKRTFTKNGNRDLDFKFAEKPTFHSNDDPTWPTWTDEWDSSLPSDMDTPQYYDSYENSISVEELMQDQRKMNIEDAYYTANQFENDDYESKDHVLKTFVEPGNNQIWCSIDGVYIPVEEVSDHLKNNHLNSKGKDAVDSNGKKSSAKRVRPTFVNDILKKVTEFDDKLEEEIDDFKKQDVEPVFDYSEYFGEHFIHGKPVEDVEDEPVDEDGNILPVYPDNNIWDAWDEQKAKEQAWENDEPVSEDYNYEALYGEEEGKDSKANSQNENSKNTKESDTYLDPKLTKLMDNNSHNYENEIAVSIEDELLNLYGYDELPEEDDSETVPRVDTILKSDQLAELEKAAVQKVEAVMEDKEGVKSKSYDYNEYYGN